MSALTSVRPTYQTIEIAPIASVEKSGVRNRGWIRPNILGHRLRRGPSRAIVRAVGRIVVCVEADADVRTAMIRSLSSREPSTALPSGASTSSELSLSCSGPA